MLTVTLHSPPPRSPPPMEKDMHVPDVLCVLAQVAPELVHELQRQSDEALEQLFGLVGLQWGGGSWRGAEREERVRRLVEHFGSALSAECARFVHALTLTCNLPLPLESQLVSAAGYGKWRATVAPRSLLIYRQVSRDTNIFQLFYNTDPVERLAAAMKADFLQRHERLCQGLVLPVRLGEVRVGLRKTGGRPREAEDGTMEHITTAEAFLTPRLGVTVLLGPPGSGKTVVTHCVAHHWAWDSLSCFRLLFLLEFRQLNVVAECLSLQQLLFGSCPRLSDKEADAVLAFVLNHPEQVCIIFDGYDEFCGRFLPSGTRDISHDPRRQLPVAELFSGLCGGTVLRGCSLLITCRARDLLDLPDSAVDHVGELLGFDRPGVMQFAQKYFQGKGHSEQALRHLLSSRHLLNMCSVPALCQICCICLDYLFSGECGGATPLPATITQVYVHSLVAFLSRAEGRGVGSQDTLLLQSYRAEVKELSRLALKGLDNGTIVFLAQDVQQDLHAFATAAGLLHPQELRWPDGPGVAGSVFVHLTVQEFLAALHLMTSEESTEAQLRQKLNLKSRWMTRCDPKSVFTDSIHLYLCGLAAPACAPYLQQLVGDSRAQLVRRRQTAVLKVLQQFAGSSSLTGPKVLELCRCAFESQDQALGQTVGLRCRFELRNIPLSPLDADALVFVISAGGRSVVLDFGGCSMDLECLEVLVTCQHISCLTFRSRKYDDRFAEAFAAVLPRLQNLRRLEFMGSSVTEAGAAKLASALKSCPHITELNLRDNVLSDRGIQHIANILPKMAGLTTVHLGKNGVSLDGVLCLMEKLVTCPVFRKLHVDSSLKDMKEIHLLFSPSHAPGEDPTVRYGGVMALQWLEVATVDSCQRGTH
ncbi:protein NLRC5 isoform X1 [Arapaima gigas]